MPYGGTFIPCLCELDLLGILVQILHFACTPCASLTRRLKGMHPGCDTARLRAGQDEMAGHFHIPPDGPREAGRPHNQLRGQPQGRQRQRHLAHQPPRAVLCAGHRQGEPPPLAQVKAYLMALAKVRFPISPHPSPQIPHATPRTATSTAPGAPTPTSSPTCWSPTE